MQRLLNIYKEQPVIITSILIILAILSLRLISLGLYPYFDTTEARYGETARIMFETKNWVTPFFNYDVPFWGKPPFYVWITALGFSSLGINEFAGRLPHFISGLVTLLIIYQFVKVIASRQSALLAILVLSTSIGFIVSSGIVMTDTALLMSVTLSMTSFWLCYSRITPKLHSHLFFIALGLGMLIKGPIAVVLAALPLFVWSFWQRCFVKAITSLYWKTGIAIFLAITLPWYVWAEIRTPGFIEYFIVGEHIKRFLVSGWEGDLYGSAHNEARGTIWWFWLLSAFPWSFVLIFRLLKTRFSLFRNKKEKSPLIAPYLIVWTITPMLFFSFSGNILPAYALPSFSAMAILLTYLVHHTNKINGLASVSVLLLAVAVSLFSINGAGRNSEYYLLKPYLTEIESTPVIYWQSAPFSARFYTKGTAKIINNLKELEETIRNESRALIAVNHDQVYMLTPILLKQLKQCEFANQTKQRILFNCNKKQLLSD